MTIINTPGYRMKKFHFRCYKSRKENYWHLPRAQLLACVLGATIYTNKHKEIGWFPITIAPSFGEWLVKDTPKELTVFHWHGDKFEIPYGGENHASSEACKHQMFTYGDNIIGLQFHLEATPNSVQLMVENEDSELITAKYIQDREMILEANPYYNHCNQLMRKILAKICA